MVIVLVLVWIGTRRLSKPRNRHGRPTVAHIHTHAIHADTYAHMCTCAHTRTNTHRHTHLHTHTHTRAHTNTHANTHTRTHTHLHLHLHTHTHTHRHICKLKCI